jgi:tagatose-1,6-bisphosphate aldolase
LELLGKCATNEFAREYVDSFEALVLWKERIDSAVNLKSSILEVYNPEFSSETVCFFIPTLSKSKQISITCDYYESPYELIVRQIRWIEG